MFINMSMKKTFKWILKVFLSWRIFITFSALIGINILPAKLGYLGGGTESYYKNPLVWGWANFDGVHYLTIAKEGYYQYQQAFFPFYPYAIRFFSNLTKNYLTSGLLVSHASFIVALYLLYQLVYMDFSPSVAKKSIIYLLMFPTSFFFGSVYTESLFLALILGSFYAARKKKWIIAGILGAFASATRFVGIYLFPALLFEWYKQKEEDINKKFKNILPLLLIFIGFGFYMWYLRKTTGDYLYFMHVQPFFGAQRSGDKIILLYQVFWRYFKMILTTKTDVLYVAVWMELLASILFLCLSILNYFQVRTSYFIYMILSFITPTLTGTFSSMPRYVLVLFPGYILLAKLTEKKKNFRLDKFLRIFYLVTTGILLMISTILFTRGYWIS